MASRSFLAWRMFTSAEAHWRHNNTLNILARARRTYNPLNDLTDTEFRKRYRLSKGEFRFLCKELRRLTSLKSSQRVSLELKVLTALFFYASGSYQRPVGVAKYISQKMCSVYIEEVTRALTHKNILEKYIRFPITPAARRTISNRFYIKYHMPGVIGCIDCSHFRIFAPPREQEHWYYCRKHYHSLNVQMICDDEYRILNVNSKFGGANHDSFIWENSNVNPYMQSLHHNGETVWLLGDSGYPQRPWLMTPILNAAPNSPESNYNTKHSKARVVVENMFGKLKNRWRCLNKDRVLHYKPLKCSRIIQACCVLHNISIDCGTMEEEETLIEFGNDDQDPNDNFTRQGDSSSTMDLIRGRIMREQLVRRLQ